MLDVRISWRNADGTKDETHAVANKESVVKALLEVAESVNETEGCEKVTSIVVSVNQY